MSEETVSFSMEINVEQAYTDVRKVLSVFHQWLTQLRRAGFSEQQQQLIAEIQQLIALFNKLRLSLAALQAARMAAGDPIAWAQFGVTATSFLFDIGEMIDVGMRGQ